MTHLLVGGRFYEVLTPGERRLRDALLGLAALGAGPDADSVRRSVAWPRVEWLLRGHATDRPTGRWARRDWTTLGGRRAAAYSPNKDGLGRTQPGSR